MKKSNVVLNPDEIWLQILDSEGKEKQLIDDLRIALVENIKLSKLFIILKYLKQVIREEKSIRILDYGCGKGQLLFYLRVLGYTNLTGVDVSNMEKINRLNKRYSNMGLGSKIFFKYDGVVLPFNSSSFDIIVSQQVIEHVHNVEQYFLESRRVLSPKGQMLLDFPHRLVPFDTHTRMWFVHYFPATIRNIIYDKYRENKSEYYNNILNLRPIWYYKNLLNTNFSFVLDVTGDRIGNFEYQDHYEGNIQFRLFANNFINMPLVGKFFKKIFGLFANATLIVTK
jgi:SAM-dependent methyltransferase